MSSSLDQLWWTSNGVIQGILQTIGGDDAQSKKLIEGHFDWILNGTTSFHPPSDGSRKLTESKTVSFKGKKFGIEPLLRPATLKLSVLLVRPGLRLAAYRPMCLPVYCLFGGLPMRFIIACA